MTDQLIGRNGAFAVPPNAERPTTPDKDYGVPKTGGEFVSWDHVIERLRAAPAYWLATVTAKARPQVVPTWGVLGQDDLYLEIGSPATAKSRNLKGNPEIQIHLDDVDDVVIVRGAAEPVVPRPIAWRGDRVGHGGQVPGLQSETDRLGQRRPRPRRPAHGPRLARHAHGDPLAVVTSPVGSRRWAAGGRAYASVTRPRGSR